MNKEEIKKAQAFIDTPITEKTLQPAVPTFPEGPRVTFRFAEPKDSGEFTSWVAGNPQIDRKDVEAASVKQNPTVTFLVIERDGVPVMFMPVYLVMRIGYLGFNPAADKEAREEAMEAMLKAAQAFAALYQITTLDVLTKSAYPVAEWARAHGFDPDARELFKLELNKKKPPKQEQ